MLESDLPSAEVLEGPAVAVERGGEAACGGG